MDNKYRINTWDPKGSQPMYKVIVNLINELNESLKTPLMNESKSDKEVRKILDNPEGIKIEELQVVDVWSVGRELRRELRNRLREAYSFLSTKATQLIEDRNEIGVRDEDGNISINDANRELKRTIVNQYEEIEKKVEKLAGEWEEKGELSEKDRKLLVYIRKVYSNALKEAIKKLFSTASRSTERVKIFPRSEQEEIISKISNLQNKISSLTLESKQEQKKEKKEKHERLESEKKELETKLNSLRDAVNNSFVGLIDSEGKVNEEVQRSIIGDLTKLKEVQQQVDKESEIVKKTTERLNSLTKEMNDKVNLKNQEILGIKATLEEKEKQNVELEKKITSLKGEVNNSFPGLINSESEVNEEIRKSIAENLSKLEKIEQQLPISVEENSNEVVDPAQEWKELYLQLEAKVEQVNHFVKK